MSAIAQKNPHRKPYKFKTKYMQLNKNLYDWADHLFFEGFIKAPVLHTLKAILATRHMKDPTLKQINEARTRSCSLKFAQCNKVSDLTIWRHLQVMKQLKIIETENYYDRGFKKRLHIEIIHPKYKLVSASIINMIMSLSCSNSLPSEERVAIHKHKKQTKKQKNHPATAAIALPADAAALAAAVYRAKWVTPEIAERLKMMEEHGMLNDTNIEMLRSSYANN